MQPRSILKAEKAVETIDVGGSEFLKRRSGIEMVSAKQYFLAAVTTLRAQFKMADEATNPSGVKYLCLFAQEHVDFRISVGTSKVFCLCLREKLLEPPYCSYCIPINMAF